jgi:putative transposase
MSDTLQLVVYVEEKPQDMLNRSGWKANHKRVERIWRQEGLKVPKKQPKRARLWLNDGSCIRLRPTHRNHVWSYDFVMDRTHDGKPIKILTLIDEYSRECLALVVDRSIKSDDVLHCLGNQFLLYGIPEHIRSDNGPEFTAKVVLEWLGRIGVKTAFI